MAGGTLLLYQKHEGGRQNLMSYQEHKDGWRDLTAMPEHKRGRGDFAVTLGTQGWQGRPYCRARNTREVGGDFAVVPGTQG